MSRIQLRPDVSLCQTDLPLDWYQEEFKPYAEEFLALPDRQPATVTAWLDPYVTRAIDHFGDELLILAHFYMGGEIVKLVERYGGTIGDSYQLAMQARDNPRSRVIVESAVHFMAEAISILARPDQAVWITNPKAGCTMEMLAKDDMVLPVTDQLADRYGDDLIVIAYMNSSGQLKALAGRTGGATCTSSNAHVVLEWALRQGKKILFLPDQHLGRNTARRLGLCDREMALLPDPRAGLIQLTQRDDERIDGARVLLWHSQCGVHTIFTRAMVEFWHSKDWTVLVHPESTSEVVDEADGSGSTRFLWETVMAAPPHARFAIGTEGHFVRNLREQAHARGIEVRHLAEVPGFSLPGCGCATMSRNDPPHLAALLDLLRLGDAPEINRVLPGDAVDEVTMVRDRIGQDERAELTRDARTALLRMVELTEASATA